jgi:hypothetical protein
LTLPRHTHTYEDCITWSFFLASHAASAPTAMTGRRLTHHNGAAAIPPKTWPDHQ